MKVKDNTSLIIFLTSFITFFILVFFYVPRPRLKNLEPKSTHNDKLILLENSFDKNLSIELKREIAIGNSYFVILENKLSFKLTPISFLSKENFDLSRYREYLPELIIEIGQKNSVKNNNYGVSKSSLKNRYQACLFDIKDKFFAYELEDPNFVPRFNDYDYWISKVIAKVLGLIKDVRPESFNCLLITSVNHEIFENENDLFRSISTNFNYQ